MPSRLTRTLACLSQLLNVVVFDGHEDEMLSSRAHRESWRMEVYLDMLFWWQPEHCRQSYEWEQDRVKR